MSRCVLFHRDFRRFTGGHLKVFDYFNHIRFSDRHRAAVYLTPQSVADHPWRGDPAVVDLYEPEKADILFVAGMDWTALAAHPDIEERVPVINLVQGFRHAAPSHPLYGFLGRRATRLCVSGEVAEALEATGRCNGPVQVIPNGIDFALLPMNGGTIECDVFIAGVKQPELAATLDARLRERGFAVDLQVRHLPRDQFLARMARAGIAVLLPFHEEGFFLPALEAMAMGVVVICPDCGGNRSFCLDRVSALTPRPDLDQLEAAVLEVARDPQLAAALREKGREICLRHDIQTERGTFLALLQQIA